MPSTKRGLAILLHTRTHTHTHALKMHGISPVRQTYYSTVIRYLQSQSLLNYFSTAHQTLRFSLLLALHISHTCFLGAFITKVDLHQASCTDKIMLLHMAQWLGAHLVNI